MPASLALATVPQGKGHTIWIPQAVEGCQAPLGAHPTPTTQSISVQGSGSHPQNRQKPRNPILGQKLNPVTDTKAGPPELGSGSPSHPGSGNREDPER